MAAGDMVVKKRVPTPSTIELTEFSQQLFAATKTLIFGRVQLQVFSKVPAVFVGKCFCLVGSGLYLGGYGGICNPCQPRERRLVRAHFSAQLSSH
jgi:hypothetical protein